MSYSPIDKPTDFFNTLTYTGNGVDDTAKTGLGFQPDWNWTKQRSGAEWHTLIDSVRGVTKYINSNDTGVERTNSNFIKSFDSDGFTLGSANDTNQNSQTYASWNWKAGGGQGSSNTDGSINTTYTSVNTTAGFSISSYTGTGSAATVGHGLGVLPSMIIIKSRSKSGQNWITWHKAFTGNNEYVELNTTDAKDTYDMIDNTSNTTSVFAISGDGNVNENGATYVAYCFADVQGYSRTGSFTVNGNSTNMIYTGFRPSFLLMKQYSSTSGNAQWGVFDNTRAGYNGKNNFLYANDSAAEDASNAQTLDFLSNGFRLYGEYVSAKAGESNIYYAVGQTLVGTNGITNNAR